MIAVKDQILWTHSEMDVDIVLGNNIARLLFSLTTRVMSVTIN